MLGLLLLMRLLLYSCMCSMLIGRELCELLLYCFFSCASLASLLELPPVLGFPARVGSSVSSTPIRLITRK